jgi:hypothetical protein
LKEKLIGFGFKEEDIRTLTRWECVSALRTQSTKATSMGFDGYEQFARGVRVTSKMQREYYQHEVNKIFKHQMKKMSVKDPEISDSSDKEDNAKAVAIENRRMFADIEINNEPPLNKKMHEFEKL